MTARLKLEFEAERFLGILGNREIEKSDSVGDRFRKKVVETGATAGAEGKGTRHKRVLQVPANTGLAITLRGGYWK